MPTANFPRNLDLVRAQTELLERFFDAGWLVAQARRKSDHPVVRRWILCQRLSAQGGMLLIPEDLNILSDIAQILLDSIVLVQCTHGTIETLDLGSIANYGDLKVQKRLKAVMIDHDQFLDAMTELTYAAWHISKGHKVVATEDSGLADFSVKIPSLEPLLLPIAND